MQLFAVIAIVGIFVGAANGQISVGSVLVENQVAPLGIDVSPRFSWTIASTARSVTQPSYRITVSALTAGGSDVWDSGVINSPSPYLAPNSGRSLSSDTQYFWTVAVVSSAGSASAQSTFTTGFLSQNDWGPSAWIGKNATIVPQPPINAFTSSNWIWAPSSGQTAPSAPAGDIALRLTYSVPSGKTATSATILATADDLFTLYANGPNFPQRDIDWYLGIPRFRSTSNQQSRVSSGGAGPAGVLFAALVSFSDGSSTILTSSTSTSTTTSAWKATTSIPADFQLPSTSDASWGTVLNLGTYGVGPWSNGVSIALPTVPIPSLLGYGTPLVLQEMRPPEMSRFVGQYLFHPALPRTPVLAAPVQQASCSGTIAYSDGSTDSIISDGSWKTLGSLPSNWQTPTFNDASWVAANVLGKYGIGPWNSDVSIPDPLGEHLAPLLRKRFVLSGTSTAQWQTNLRPCYDPGFTKYDKRMQYVAVDIKNLLNGGSSANAIGAELGRSHYGVTQGSVWNWAGAPWHGEPYCDSYSVSCIPTGHENTLLDDIFGGENYDARYEVAGWNLASFDNSAWNTALLVPAPKGALIHARQPPTRVTSSFTPISITQPSICRRRRTRGFWMVKLTVTGARGSLVTIHDGEKISTDGTVIYQDTQHYYLNNFQTDRYWLSGTGSPEVFEPKFLCKGYQHSDHRMAFLDCP
ncbi:hypothetical protein MIND_01124400 [Mycena indigotica]|uniref:Fibronectin type-III domain-containing protein n=1 Tax=Mycena indigotica TaxID=2126181 RepID=A0A8H6S6V2_9AGAR|nr:uncharacterized protein MIND_01124400 [Mycena indigotica]KAF7293467.1 hypothetical protein MIND_01124400 [Mycena indigotica]